MSSKLRVFTMLCVALCSLSPYATLPTWAQAAPPDAAHRSLATEESAAYFDSLRQWFDLHRGEFQPLPLPLRREVPVMPGSDSVVSYNPRTGQAVTTKPFGPSPLPQASQPGMQPADTGRIQHGESNPLDNFSALSLVSSPSAYPFCTAVKLFVTFPGGTGQASGMLIDASHVITAGHCVYYSPAGGWATSIEVIPAYQSGSQPFGDAFSVQLHSWNGWVNNGDFNWDMGVIDLDRTVGALTGWQGYGYNDTDNYFLTNTFNNPGYPAESPYNGCCMYNWSGTFDAAFTYYLQFNRRSYEGQSGSGAYNSANTVYAVLSNGNTSLTNDTRIQSSRFTDIQTIINADIPSSVDLIAMDCNASPTTIQAGSTFSSFDILAHNYSSASWSGTLSMTAYVSVNDQISAADTPIGTASYTGTIGARGSVRLTWTTRPTIPSSTPAGNDWVGVIFNITDYNTGNNASSYDDAQPVTITPGPTVTVQTPNGGETLTKGGSYNITWTSTGGVGNVLVHLYQGTAPHGTYLRTLQAGTPNDGSLIWNPVDCDLATGSNYYIGIAEASDGDPSDFSNGAFTITGGVPAAEFTVNTQTGCRSQTNFNFTDQSTGSPTSWDWDYGDGVHGYTQNPTHQYTSTGTYTVRLTATNTCGSNTRTRTNYITVTGSPSAAFTVNTNSGCAGSTNFCFTDQSTGGPTSWSWEFGDGGTSPLQNACHVYQNTGSYTVRLTVTNACGSTYHTNSNYISVTARPVAAFTWSGSCRQTPLTFTDQSTNSPTSWNWNFGDGGTSTAQNPTHQYASAGTYAVTLTSSNSCGQSQNTASNSVTVYEPTVAGFIPDQYSGCLGSTVFHFTDQSTYNPTSWSWNFGDGGTSTQQNPTHVYNGPGNYTVTLTANNICGYVGNPASRQISVTGHPDAAFTPSATSGCAGSTSFSFTDQSTNSPNGWSWAFGDGGTSTQQNPTHTYANPGVYTVSLFASNNCGQSSGPATHDITVVARPVAAFNPSATSGCAGSTVFTFTDQSTYSPISWNWAFGDGGTSTLQNPTHTYASAGNYTVTLTCTNSCGQSLSPASRTIAVAIVPVSQFGVNTTSGCAGTTVFSFTDQSTNTPTGWSWNFGDGGTSTLQNPTHTYSAAGTFTATLVASNGCGSGTPAATRQITVSAAPTAAFSSPATGCINAAVSFTDQSTNTPTSWSWTFGDGGTSSLQNPTHTYSAAGTYTVSLTCSNSCGPSASPATHQVTIGTAPTAAFSSPATGCINVAVSFTDQSTNTPTGWSWAFGDGGTSTQQHPTHAYASTGTFTVTLTCTNGCGQSQPAATRQITIGRAPVAAFSLPATGCINVAVSFTDQSINNPTGWSWAFGDGGTSTLQNPSHTFTAAGTYHVCLTATNACGQNSYCQDVTIGTVPAQVTGVAATTNRCDSVIVTWNNVANEAGYRILRNGTPIDSVGVDVVRFADSPSPGTYPYTVVAYNLCGSGLASAPVTGTRGSGAPVVSNVLATDSRCDSIAITWTAVTGADSLQVQRNGARIAGLPASAVRYADFPAAGAYQYRILAFNYCGSNAAADSGHKLTALPPMANVQASDTLCDSVIVVWDPVTGADSLQIRRNGVRIGRVNGTATRYADAPAAGAYLYEVQAYAVCGASQASADSGHRAILLPAVTGLTATTDNCAAICITWSALAGVDSFQIRRGVQRVGVVSGSATQFCDSSATAEQWLTYTVIGYNACGAGNQSSGVLGYRISNLAYGTWSLSGSPHRVNCTLTVPVGQTLTIEPGVQVRFDADAQLKVFGNLIAEGTATDSIVFWADTLTNPSRWGGVRILIATGENRFKYCKFLYGDANGADNDGMAGALYADSSRVLLKHCLFAHNRAVTVGAVNMRKALTGSFIDSCVFVDNVTQANGGSGALRMSWNGVPVSHCLFAGNRATWGGAVEVAAATGTFTNCTFVNNQATTGGGIGMSWSVSTQTYNSCIFSQNGTHSLFNLENGATASINYSDVADMVGGFSNHTPPPGFGVKTQVNVNGDSVDTYHNLFTNPQFADSTIYALSLSSPCVNAADPALPRDLDGTLADQGYLWTNVYPPCVQQVQGVWTLAQSPYLVSCNLVVPIGQSLTMQPGVQVKFLGDYMLIVNGTLSAQGTASDSITFWADTLQNPSRWGGVRLIHAPGENRLAYCKFLNGSALATDAVHDGGAVACDSAVLIIRHSSFVNNRASNGGAIEWGQALPGSRVDSCLFGNNSAVGSGGAIDINWNPLPVSHCLFVNNHAGYGGAVSSYRTTWALTQCTFVGNSASSAGAIGSLWGGSEAFNSCVFSGNIGSRAFDFGSQGTAQVNYSCWNNMPASFGQTTPSGFAVLSRTNASGDSTDTYFNLFRNPRFASTVTYALADTSPCIDAGDPVLGCDPDFTLPDMGWKTYMQPMSPFIPDSLVIQVNGQNAILRWRPVATPCGNLQPSYTIYWSQTPDTGYTMITTVSDTAFTIVQAFGPAKAFYKVTCNLSGAAALRSPDGPIPAKQTRRGIHVDMIRRKAGGTLTQR